MGFDLNRVAPGCPFCNYDGPSEILDERGGWDGTFVIEPLEPVTPGHLLVIPRLHVEDVAEEPWAAAAVMKHASLITKDIGDCNLITSKGPAATQTVPHFHLHVVPRREGDGLALPWTAKEEN